MDSQQSKKDRTARLLNLELVLWQHPKGIDVKVLADKCGVSSRTIYRDLEALESELGVPIWEERSKRGITEGYFLPPVRFSFSEAINIYFAVRMLHRFSTQSNANIASTFMKLRTVIPEPFNIYIQDTIDYLYKKPEEKRKIDNFDKLIKAWISHNKVKIAYQEDSGKYIYDRIIEIYYFEPIGVTHSGFIIAYCHYKKKILGLLFEQIVGDIVIEPDTYVIPSDFSAVDYLDTVWECFTDEEIENIKLRIDPDVSIAYKDVYWHPSQKVEITPDGSILLTLRVRNSVYFRAWVLGWGQHAEVLEPESLRNQIIEMNNLSLNKYTNKFSFKDLTDDQWELILPILPQGAGTGRPRSDERKNIDGILWVLRTGERWADVPRRYGSRSTCHSRLKFWKANGVWDKILQMLRTTAIK